MQNSLENYRTRNTQTFCPVLERQNVMGFEIVGPVHFFSDPPLPVGSKHLFDALGGDGGGGGWLGTWLLNIIIYNYDYTCPLSYQSRFLATCCSDFE